MKPTAHPTPLVDGLTTYEIEVNGDDPRWRSIEPDDYVSCDPRASPSDFPVKPGKRKVRYVLLGSRVTITNQQLVNEVRRRNLSHPDRATVETILDTLERRCVDSCIVGLCAGSSAVAVVGGDVSGRDIGVLPPDHVWNHRSFRFVAVVSEEPVP